MYFTIHSTNAAFWCKMRKKKITDTKTEETDKQRKAGWVFINFGSLCRELFFVQSTYFLHMGSIPN